MTSTNGLRLAADLTLPLDSVTQMIAVLAQRGAGKTYAASVLAEEMLKAAVQVVVIDPLDVWWGLRASADGEQAGLPVVVFGGARGDLPLTPDNAAVIADLVIEQGLSVVLSVSHLRKKEQRAFVGAFCERLYQRKIEPTYRGRPLHIILDEADLFIPQRLTKGTAEASRDAVADIAQRGRARGLGATVISQRAAVLDKDTLTQADTLIVLRTTGLPDRKAMEAWLETHLREAGQRIFVETLPSLPVGTAWVWSPGANLFQQIQVRRRETFDSSATPKVGEVRAQPKALAAVDLGRLRTHLAATIEKAEADDPRRLRARIAELERQLQAGGRVETRVERVVEYVEVPVLSDEARDQLSQAMEALMVAEARFQEIAETIQESVRAVPLRTAPVPQPAPVSRTHTSAKPPSPEGTPAAPSVELDTGARGLLEVLLQRHPLQFTRTQLATLAGRGQKSSSYAAQIALLKKAGLVDEQDRLLGLTPAAVAAYGAQLPTPQSSAEVRAMWRQRLPDGPRKMLDVLSEAYPTWIARDDLATASGYSPTSSSVGAHLKVLRDNGLVEVERGHSRASDVLFLV